MSTRLHGRTYLQAGSLVVLIAFFAGLVHADVRLPKIISDNMVLQKSAKTAVWGWADPNEPVTVTLGQQSAKTTADAEGKWKLTLDLSKSGPGPFQLTVAGKNQLTVANVAVGEVWVNSGQSNMEFLLKTALNAPDEIAKSANPLLRQFIVPHAEKTDPMDDCTGKWIIADPQTSGDFSAVGYFFAKRLQNDLKVPVGFIHSSFGGTASEQWTSSEGLDPDPELKAAKDTVTHAYATFVAARKAYPDLFTQWLTLNHREDQPSPNPAAFAAVDAPTTGWSTVSMPGTVAGAGLPAAGTFWLRKEVTLTADQVHPNTQAHPADSRFYLEYNAGSNDYETLYWNGEKVIQYLLKDRSGPLSFTHRYQVIPPNLLKEGKNVIALRIFSPVQAPQLTGDPKIRGNAIDIGAPPLAGDWLVKAEFPLPPLDPAVLAAVPPDPFVAFSAAVPKNTPMPCQLFNGMINPLISYTIAGVIWYQGESNAVRAYQYRTAFPLLIKDWRAHWKQGDFPFYYCQLAGLGRASPQPADNNWAELRESQLLTLSLPNTGQAVLVDIGEAGNIHPRDKKDVGDRLALIALANVYGQKIPYSGPAYQSMKVEADKIRVTFQHTDGGLVAKPLADIGKIYYTQIPPKVLPTPTSPNSDLQGFAICGADHKWVWADAKIDGASVLVWSAQVPQPLAVRYGWDGYPTCNLYNGADLPASPFRTDDFPLSTADVRYGKETTFVPQTK
jgi:sialate O-acetylesterase